MVQYMSGGVVVDDVSCNCFLLDSDLFSLLTPSNLHTLKLFMVKLDAMHDISGSERLSFLRKDLGSKHLQEFLAKQLTMKENYANRKMQGRRCLCL